MIVRTPAAATALLDPVRQRLLRNLEFPISASGLARRLRMPRQKVNYHLRELERAGLVRLVRERKVGNCTERLVEGVATEFVLGPELLGKLGPEPRTAPDSTRLYSARFRDEARKLAFFVDLHNEVIRLLEQHGAGDGGGDGEGEGTDFRIRVTSHPESSARRLPDPKVPSA